MDDAAELGLEPDPFCDAQSACTDAAKGRGSFAGARYPFVRKFLV
jgi:hypothetical protein